MRFALRFLALTLLLFALAVPAASAKPPQLIEVESPFGFCASGPSTDPDLDFTPAPNRSLKAMDDGDWGCRCTYYNTVCSPYVRCYTEYQCRIDMVCNPTDCTEVQTCEPEIKCDYDWYCWRECGRYECYI